MPRKRNLSSLTTTSANSTKMLTSHEKGSAFEKEVAHLYRLLGAEIVTNVEICNKKVDILATFSHPVRHRVIVECKDEKRVVNANQRVMQFKALLDLARSTGQADSAEIVTRVSWGDAAKGFALNSGVSLLTYTEKLRTLLDLSFYLNEVVFKYSKGEMRDEPPLADYYVDSEVRIGSTSGTEVKPLQTWVLDWLLQEDSTEQLALFGEYGSGKSSFCQKLGYDLAIRYFSDQSSRIPVLLNLRSFVDKIDIESLITSFLDRECQVSNPRFQTFKAMNEAGMFLVIFDGLDEMAVKVDAETLETNLYEIEKIAAPQKAKVLITSRPEYFISGDEERQVLNPNVNALGNRGVNYRAALILPWQDDRIELFLQRRVPLSKKSTQPWTYYKEQIEKIKGLQDLSQRPVLLEMIVKSLPALIASNLPVDRPNLYRTYLKEEIRRQRVLKKRKLLLTQEQRLSLLTNLAGQIAMGEIPSLTFSEASSQIEHTVKPPRLELEAYTRDFLTNSFLVRRGNEYVFSHKSILEYLAASLLTAELQSNKPALFGLAPLDPAIISFILEMTSELENLWDWITMTKDLRVRYTEFIGGNAASILARFSETAFQNRDLSGTNLRGANLSGADLLTTNLDGARLEDANLVYARFNRRTLQNTQVGSTILSINIWTKSQRSLTYPLSQLKDSLVKLTYGDPQILYLTEVARAAYSQVGPMYELIVRAHSLAVLNEFRTRAEDFLGLHMMMYSDDDPPFSLKRHKGVQLQ